MSLGIRGNRVKIGALLAYLANMVEDMTLSKLVNMVYLIDVEFVRLRGFPLTWLDYYAWADGPVSPELYAIKDKCNHFSDFVVAKTNAKQDLVIIPLIQVDNNPFGPFGEISEYELSIVDTIISEYGYISLDDLRLHNMRANSLWAKSKKINCTESMGCKADLSIDLLDEIRDNQEACQVYEDARWSMEFQAQLDRKP